MSDEFRFSDRGLDMAKMLGTVVKQRPGKPLTIHSGQNVKVIGVVPMHVRGLHNMHSEMLMERDELQQRLQRLAQRLSQVKSTITDSIRAAYQDLDPKTLFCVVDEKWGLGIILTKPVTRSAKLKQSVSGAPFLAKGTKTRQ